MNRNNFVIWVFVLAILGFGIWYYWPRDKQTDIPDVPSVMPDSSDWDAKADGKG